MKKLVLVLAVIFVNQIVLASPDPRPGIVLRQTGVVIEKNYRGQMPEVRLMSNGIALAGKCSATKPQRCDLRKVEELSAYEMDRIFDLIEQARDGEIQPWYSGARCFRAPDFMSKYTADNGSVFLKDGAVCLGGGKINASDEARTLINRINSIYLRSLIDPGHVGTKCPRPGTVINCMPPTSNPSCRPGIRSWIQKHCSGVSYLD